MLAKSNRLNQKAEFQKVLKKGKMIHTPLLALAFLKTDLNSKKFGIIVSNKVSKKAVERNRIRRNLREAIKELLNNIPNGVQGVFLVKSQAESQENSIIRTQAQQLLKKC